MFANGISSNQFSETINFFSHPPNKPKNFKMKSVIAILAFVAAASAGNLYSAPIYSAPLVTKTVVPAAQSYSYSNRAPSTLAVAAAPVAYAAAPVYSAPVVAKAVVPAAQSFSYANRAPAKLAVAASPVYASYAHPAPVATYAAPAQVAYAHAAPVVAAHPQAVYHTSFSTPYAHYAF